MIKPIKNFPGYYVDNNGNVYGNRKHKGNWNQEMRKLTPHKCQGGYYFVNLFINGKGFPKKVHRLVLETFLGKCPRGMEACHIINDKKNNKLINLKWDTRQNNMKERWSILNS